MILDQYGKPFAPQRNYIPEIFSKMIAKRIPEPSIFAQEMKIHELRESCGVKSEAKDTIKIGTRVKYEQR